jgi:glycosyltransferase involved in cell wall biosynthesis
MISVVIPTLNEEREIGTTLANLKPLIDAGEVEVIVSDGGSQDQTVELARSYTPHVFAYQGSERQTIAGGRNLGAAQAQGEYLLFIDADVSIPNASRVLKDIVLTFEQNASLVGLTAFVGVRPQDATLADRLIFGFMNYFNYAINNIFHIGGGPGEFLFVRKSAFAAVGGFREDIPVGEDFELFRRLKKVGKLTTYAGLTILHSGRRAHTIGWPKLLFQWATNNLSVMLLNRSAQGEWKPIR